MADLALYTTTLKDLFRPRRLAVGGVVALTPALLALFIRLAAGQGFDPVVTYDTLAAGMIFGFVLILLSIILGTSILTQELDGKTIVYLLTRAVPRWRILLAKFAGAATAIILAVWFSTAVLAVVAFGPAGLVRGGVLRDLGVLPAGVVVYAGLSILLATFMARPLLLALAYGFGWESWVPILPGHFNKVSMLAYLRILAPHKPAEGESQAIDMFGGLVGVLNPEPVPHWVAWIVVLGVAFGALLFALLLFSSREYVPREDAD